jgi:hypothetical protein
VNKSSNHTLSLHRLTYNSSSTTNFPWLSPTDNWLNSHSRTLYCTPLYSHSLHSPFWVCLIRPTVSQPVCLGIKHPHWVHDQIFVTVKQLLVCWCWKLSLTRGRVCRLKLLLVSPAQSFSGPSPMGFVTTFYCLRFETSLFVASYDSQGCGGGIRPASKRDWLSIQVKVTLRLTVSQLVSKSWFFKLASL